MLFIIHVVLTILACSRLGSMKKGAEIFGIFGLLPPAVYAMFYLMDGIDGVLFGGRETFVLTPNIYWDIGLIVVLVLIIIFARPAKNKDEKTEREAPCAGAKTPPVPPKGKRKLRVKRCPNV